MKTLKTFSFPSKMKALVLHKYDTDPVLEEIEVPRPGKGEVLIKMDSSPVNPSDLSFLKGMYSTKKKTPVVPGFEGSGIVVATGDDLMSKRVLGKPVSCFAPTDGNGTWAEFMMTRSNSVIPLKKNVDMEQASMLLVNPLSAYAMIQIAKSKRSKAILNTAAASQLGQMMIRLSREENLPIVNIVRRQDQVDMLKNVGAEHVLNSTEKDFADQLMKICNQLKVSLAFDAIAGDMTFQLLEALPSGGEVMVYGGLSEKPAMIDPGKLIFQKKSVSGFWLSEWITHQGMIRLLFIFNKIQKFIGDKYRSSIYKRVSLKDTMEGVKSYNEKMSLGKILIKPGE